MYSGNPVTLEKLLLSRENRMFRQREWLKCHSLPLISFTINMVGEVKVNQISQIAFKQGIQAIHERCLEFGATVIVSKRFELNTGLEFMASVDNISALDLKKVMVEIEDHHPLGRLFDIDILDTNFDALSRDNMMLPRRQCIVCESDAKICARSRTHSKEIVIEKMSELIHQYT